MKKEALLSLEVVQAPVRPLRPRFQFQRPAQEPEETFVSFISTYVTVTVLWSQGSLQMGDIFGGRR